MMNGLSGIYINSHWINLIRENLLEAKIKGTVIKRGRS
jgi:hypothetical protein